MPPSTNARAFPWAVLLFSFSSHALHVPRAMKSKLDSRREWIANAGQVATATAASIGVVPTVQAFENAIPEAKQYADKPKRHGPKPTDLVSFTNIAQPVFQKSPWNRGWR